MQDFIVESRPLQTPIDTCCDEICELVSELPEGRLLVTVRGLPGAGVTDVLRRSARSAREFGWSATLIDLADCDPAVPFAVIDRLVNRIPFLIPLAEMLGDDAAVDDIADHLVRTFNAAADASDVPIMIALDHIERADAESAAVLREFLTNRRARGVFVVGDLLSHPTKLGRTLAQAVYEDTQARLFVLPAMNASEVAALVAQRLGKRITHYGAERLRQTTGGRYGVVSTYLSGIDADKLTDEWTLRSLPRMTTRRLTPDLEVDFSTVPAVNLLAAELISLHRQGIPLQVLTYTAQQLGLPAVPSDLRGDRLIVIDSQTGLYELYDPLMAPEIVARISPERRRALNGVLATDTHGPESLIHWIDALGELTEDHVELVLASARTYEESGQGLLAVRALYHASSRTHGGRDRERLLMAFGFACIRNQVVPLFSHAIADIAPLSKSSVAFSYIYAYLYSFKPHEQVLAKFMRAETLELEAETLDDRFMQADIAWLDTMIALLAGQPTEESWDRTERMLTELVDDEPDSWQLQWIQPRGRLLQREAYRVMQSPTPKHRSPREDPEALERFSNAADALPPDSAEAVNCLTLVAGALIDAGDYVQARTVAETARARADALSRVPLLRGRLDVAELEIAIADGTCGSLQMVDDWTVSDAFDAFDMESQVAWHAMRSWIWSVRGDFSTAERHLQVAAIGDVERVRGHASDWLAFARANLEWHRSGPDAALDVLEFALDEPRNALAVHSRIMRVDLFAQTGQRAEAEAAMADVLEKTRHWSRQHPTLVRLGARMEHVRGNHEAAVEQHRAALPLSSSPYFKGLCHLGLADDLWKIRGERENALEALAAARDEFGRVKAKPFIALADQLRAVMVEASADRFVQLSTRERQTVMLAGQGWRNKEIAAELGISAATVAFHLSNAFAKLGLRKRSELSSMLRGGPAGG